MIGAKLKGKEVTEVAQPHLAPVVDLMEVLRKSLAASQTDQPQRVAARSLSLLPLLVHGLFRQPRRKLGRSLPVGQSCQELSVQAITH